MRPSTLLMTSGHSYEWMPTGQIAQHPTMWRFITYGSFRGSKSLGIPSMTSWTYGWGVFDWSEGIKRYELVSFRESTTGYGVTLNGSFCWTNNTDVRVLGDNTVESASTTTRCCGKISVSASGYITFVEPTSTVYGGDYVGYAVFYSGWAAGYNSGIVYPYGDGAFSPSPTSNCYIGKIVGTTSATNLGPLRSGLTSGAQHAPLAVLGGTAAGNGYAVGVQNTNNDTTTTYSGLYNISGASPSLVTTKSFSGASNTWPPIHIGARKVIVPTGPSDSSKMSLLYTNSDTTPTTLTLGGQVSAPTSPVESTNIDYGYLMGSGYGAQNLWVSEGKGIGMLRYKLLVPPVGTTYKYYQLPCKYLSTGISDLSVFPLLTDINGNATPIESLILTDSVDTTIQYVGAPGSRAVMLWGVSSINNQTIFQL